MRMQGRLEGGMLKTVNFKYQISNSKIFIYILCSVFFILLFINLSYAQEDTAVTTVEPQTEVATSPDTQPDVTTTESSTSDAEPEIISDSTLKPVQISSEGNSGAAITSLPIIVPPGRKGIQPNISLTYNSNSGNGWLGVGWSLDMGAIQRNTKKGLNYGANDFVAVFNGNVSELLQRGITNYYDPKIEGEFSKYEKTSSGWLVTKKDGTKYYYGKDPYTQNEAIQDNSYGTFKWCLVRVQDTNGNYMTITYWKDYPANGEIYLDRIDYTGNVSLPTTNYVKFVRDNGSRTDAPVMFTTNASVKTARRLETIEVYSNGQMVRKYKLEYDADLSLTGLQYSASTGRSLLGKITQYGNDGVTSLPAIELKYENISYGFDELVNPTNRNLKGTDVASFVGDFNGDGKSDIMRGCDQSTCNNILLQSTGTGFTEILNPTEWMLADIYSLLVGDFNEDGKSDIVRDFLWSVLLLSTGNGFTEIIDPTTRSLSGTGIVSLVGDFNGDGKSDIIRGCDSSCSNILLLSTGNGFTEIVNATPRDLKGTGIVSLVGDFNGDGKSDIMRGCVGSTCGNIILLSTGNGFTEIHNSTTRSLSGTGIVSLVGDFNGDGKSDIMRGCDGSCSSIILLSTGNGFTEIVDPTTRSLKGTNIVSLVGDFNGDGKSDIMRGCDGSCSSIILLSTGNGFTEIIDPTTRSLKGTNIVSLVGDFDGDGKSDIMRGCDGSCSNILLIGLEGAKSPLPDHLISISNGSAGATTLEYKPSSVYDNCIDIGGKDTCLPFVVQTVSTVTTNDGNGNSSIKSYTYSGGYYDYAEREFRGFQNVKSQDCQTYQNNVCTPDLYGKQTESWYYQDNIFKRLSYEKVTKDQNNFIYTRTLNTYLSKQSPTNTNVNFPYLQQQDNYVFDGITQDKTALSSAWHTRISFGYNDDYGNLTSKTYEDLAYPEREDKKTEYTAYYYDLTNWIVSLPSTKYVTDKDNIIKAQDWFIYYAGTTNLRTKESWLQGATNNPITTYVYYTNGNLWKETDPKNNPPTITTYDTATSTFPATITNPKGHVISKTYDPVFVDKVKTETDANSKETTYGYDTFGRLQTITRPQPYGITVYSYPGLNTPGNQFGTMTQHIRKEEKDLSATLVQWKETYFDGLGRTVSQKRGGPGVTDVITDTQYNSQGLVWKKSNPYFSGAVNIYNAVNSYDPVGRLVYTVNPDATETSIGYMQGTNTYIDANYHKKEEIKDIYGRTVEISEYTGTGTTQSPYVPYATTAYWYDVLNNLETVVDAKLNQTDILYDTLSRKTSMDDPDMGHWEYQYDLNGNLKYQKDARLHEIFFQYDELNRLRQKDYGTQKTLGSGDIVYTYDQGSSSINPVGRLTTLTDNISVTIDTYAYDPKGQIKETGKTINSQTYTTKTGYDSLGRVETVTYPDNTVVKYTHDALDNLIQVKDPSNSPVYAVYGNYNAKGQYGTVTNANGVSTTYQYNPYNNRLTSILTNSPTSGNLMNLAYDLYDDAGNIKHITDSITYPGGISRTRSYVYDDLDRLIEADSPSYSGKLLYQYDKIGNMTYNCKYGYYHYDDPAHVHAVTSVVNSSGQTAYTYQYDPNGNMYSGAGRGLTYDYDNRPTHITANGATVDSVYDANGQRVKKSVSGSTTIYIGQTYVCTNGQCTKYIISGTQIVAQISAAGTYYYHSDHLGSSSIITNASGSKAEDIFYYPYGETRDNTNPPGENVNVKYKFTGKELDGEDGLYYYGARYYDPKLARFISADTIVPKPFYPISLNRYAYTYNNPIVLKDLDGHAPNDYWNSYYWDYSYNSYQNTYYNSYSYSYSYSNYTYNNYSYSSNYSSMFNSPVNNSSSILYQNNNSYRTSDNVFYDSSGWLNGYEQHSYNEVLIDRSENTTFFQSNTYEIRYGQLGAGEYQIDWIGTGFTRENPLEIPDRNPRSYGTAYIGLAGTSMDIHGGGKGASDPWASLQGWYPTDGCYRMQNIDTYSLAVALDSYRNLTGGYPIVRIQE